MMDDEKAEEVVEEEKVEAEEDETETEDEKEEEEVDEVDEEEEEEAEEEDETEAEEEETEAEDEEEVEGGDDDIEKLETEMDALCFIKKIIDDPTVRAFIPSNYWVGRDTKVVMEEHLNIVETSIKGQHANNALDVMEGEVFADQVLDSMEQMISLARSAKNLTKEDLSIFGEGSNKWDNMSRNWEDFLCTLRTSVSHFQYIMENDSRNKMQFTQLINLITKSLQDVKNLEMSLLDTKDSSTCIPLNNLETPENLLLLKAFPSLVGLKESSFKVIRSNDLWVTAKDICYRCREVSQTLAVILVGGLLSFKPQDYKIWQGVLKDLRAKKDLEGIFSYCIRDLPSSLEYCYIYLACYPMGYEIPTESITKIWIAEGFIVPEEGDTREDTTHKYLEQLEQRSLIWVSKRSISGTIKYFRVFLTMRNYLVKYSKCYDVMRYKTMAIMAVNPKKVEMGSLRRVAINKDDKYKYPKVKSFYMRSFLAFDTNINVLRSARFLRVLELRKSVVQETVLEIMVKLRYLGLRGCNISELPKNIENMKDLQTLDVRDTKIETLPESLWNISALRHVYVNHGPQIEGPPPTANIPNLQTLKIVRVPQSWKENVPNLSINLRKLALSYVGYLKLETFSNPLSRMVDLISITMMAPIVHAELVDTRAFPNLNTLKSIKLVGIWNFRKLSIDNVEFPSNLAKLILSNSRLREDPMPRLERLQALKLLRLEDGAYTEDKMVCSANGFPQLQFLKLSQLENLKIWEVKPMAMSKLTTLRVVKCLGLTINLSDLEHVKDIVIDN